jgi:DNA modification methylase
MTPYYQDQWATLYCADCEQVLPQLSRHDLLLTDPPYGMNQQDKNGSIGSGCHTAPKKYGAFYWDKIPIADWLIFQAIAKCDKAIIFGGNFYYLPPCRCWLVWDKDNTGYFADCELAWTNLDKAVRLYRHNWNGMWRKNREERFHPTQKPLDVMSWCLGQCPETQSVLDPFAGSGTTLVAAKLRNIKSTGIEREERYCEIAANRLNQEVFDFDNGDESKNSASSGTVIDLDAFRLTP